VAKVNIHEAKTNLSKLIERAQAGEEIIIAKAGRPVVRLLAVERPTENKGSNPQGFGCMAGQIWLAPDFDEPDASIEDVFYNSEILPK
jgi:prevent-host-death family protein